MSRLVWVSTKAVYSGLIFERHNLRLRPRDELRVLQLTKGGGP